MYPEEWVTEVCYFPQEAGDLTLNPQNSTSTNVALAYASTSYPSLVLLSAPLITLTGGDRTWRHSVTKLNIFRLDQYSRVLYFDSDTLILRPMDHLFHSPAARIALPRAYWLEPPKNATISVKLGSHVMLVEPDLTTYRYILRKVTENPEFDMEVVNHIFGSTAMVLPHRHLALLSGEFRKEDHRQYLGEIDAMSGWDPEKELEESYLVHFSDWPLPKPWLPRTIKEWDEALPLCTSQAVKSNSSAAVDDDCPDRREWVGLYGEYDAERARVCRSHSFDP